MKTTIHRLRIGDKVWAQVLELLSNEEMIVNFNGDLIRVRNESQKPLYVGDKVLVQAVAIRPLQFQIVSEQKDRATRLNVSA